MDKSRPSITGRARLKCYDKNGAFKFDTGWLYNTITNASLAEYSGLIGGVGAKTAFTYLAVGTSSTAESKTHTALQAETTTNGLERASVTPTQETTVSTDDTLQLYKEWTASGSVSVEEIGIFNAASAGTMAGRKLTGIKAVTSGDKLQGTYQLIFAEKV
jgi:hypothetical protein